LQRVAIYPVAQFSHTCRQFANVYVQDSTPATKKLSWVVGGYSGGGDGVAIGKDAGRPQCDKGDHKTIKQTKAECTTRLISGRGPVNKRVK